MTNATPPVPSATPGSYQPQDPRTGGTDDPAISFADLLASLKQTELPDAEAAQVQLKAGAPRSSGGSHLETFLGADTDQAAGTAPKQRAVAEIFNEHGLTQPLEILTGARSSPAADNGRITATDPVTTPPSGRTPAMPPAPPLHSSTVAYEHSQPGSISFETQVALSAASARTEHASLPRTRGGKIDPDAPQAIPSKPPHRNDGRPPRAGAEGQERASRLKTVLERALSTAQAKDVQLTVEFAEQGMRIFAWIGNLARLDRGRLRSEIARIADAHGLPAFEVRLNGEEIDPLEHGKDG